MQAQPAAVGPRMSTSDSLRPGPFMRASETMTVATLAAEIRRQAVYHAGQDDPFPRIALRVGANTRDGRRGSIRLTSHQRQVEISVNDGFARVILFSPAGDREIAVCTAEWSAAVQTIALFMTENGEAAPMPAVVTVPWKA